MGVYEYTINELCKTFTKEQLAEQLLTHRELASIYKNDNDTLRNANESLMYLIAKYHIEKE